MKSGGGGLWEHRTLHPHPPRRWEKVWPTAVITYFSWTKVPTCERCLHRVGGGALVLNLDQTDINRFILNAQSFFSHWQHILMPCEERSAATQSKWNINKQGTNPAMVRGSVPCLIWLSTSVYDSAGTLTRQKKLCQMYQTLWSVYDCLSECSRRRKE